MSEDDDFLTDDEALTPESVKAAILKASQDLEALTWTRKIPSRLDPRSILYGLGP